MATLTLTHKLTMTDTDSIVEIGSLTTSNSITVTNGQIFRAENKTIADNFTADILWTTGEGGMNTFELGLIKSNVAVVMELRTDNSTAEFVLLNIPANVPVYFGAKVGGNTTESLDGAILVDGTDFDDVDRIEVQRDVADVTGDATVDLYLFN